MKVEVGSIVKCYDFPGVTSCYMIGEVAAIEGNLLVCNLIKTVFENKTKKNSVKEFRTPMQGDAFGDSMFERVIVVG